MPGHESRNLAHVFSCISVLPPIPLLTLRFFYPCALSFGFMAALLSRSTHKISAPPPHINFNLTSTCLGPPCDLQVPKAALLQPRPVDKDRPEDQLRVDQPLSLPMDKDRPEDKLRMDQPLLQSRPMDKDRPEDKLRVDQPPLQPHPMDKLRVDQPPLQPRPVDKDRPEDQLCVDQGAYIFNLNIFV